jgi:hypothetical protein
MGLTVEQLDSMKADAQATFADMIKDCKRDQAFVDVIAKMQGMPTTDVGEVARELRLLVASVEETDAAEKRATADIAKTAIVGTVTLGTGLILGSAIEAAIDGAGHNSYTAGNISQSNSINGIEGEGINLNGGDRSNVVAFGEDMFIQDLDIRQDGDSPNALITNDSEKPNAQDGAGDSLYNDSLDGANNDTSLF